MKKIFGSKKEKKDRPASASDSTLRVPSSPGRIFSSTERISIFSSTTSSTTVNTSRTITQITNGTFPRQSYKPVYERTQELSRNFDRMAALRHSTTSGSNKFNLNTPQRPSSSSSFLPSTSYYRPPPSPLSKLPSAGTAMQMDAKLLALPVPSGAGAIQRLPINSYNLQDEVKIKVKKCNKPIIDSEQRIPTYKTHTKGKRGSFLVINNIKFDKHEKERKGAEKDVKNIMELFKQMNFDGVVKTNLKKSEMESELKNYSKKKFYNCDVNVVVMMSHGCGDAASNSTQIVGTDGRSLPTADVVDYFTNFNCPELAGKPKIFIFQCCRGDKVQEIFTDAKKTVSHQGDMLLAYATIPGFVSYRQEFIGSWYIQAICKVFMTNAHDTHVEDMLRMVDCALTKKAEEFKRAQTSSFENRGFKCCYFNPI